VLFGGSIFGLFGGAYYWWPKFTGRLLSEKLGKLHFWLWFIGFNVTFAPFHIVGLQGMPRRIYTYPTGMGWDVWNFVETIGAYIIMTSVIVFIVNIIVSRRKKEEAVDDPWDARTLEWSIPSPPPEYNFAVVPNVTHRDDWWHRKYVESPEGAPVPVIAGGANAHEQSDEGHGIHLPSPSFFPLIVASGLPIMGYGVIYFNPIVLGLGALVTMLGVFGWIFEPGAADEH
jgi:cytochrome c oxidase subunit I